MISAMSARTSCPPHCADLAVKAGRLAAILAGLMLFPAAIAAEPSDGAGEESTEPYCPDAQVLSGKMITDICWDCIYPVRIGGMEVGEGHIPSDAADDITCSCPDDNGIPQGGFSEGMWEPARLIETTRLPYCAPALGGIFVSETTAKLWGGASSRRQETAGSAINFYNYHVYAFPVMAMLDLFFERSCAPDYTDFDMLFVSEIDPTHNDDELAFALQVESMLFSNPVALAACLPESAGLSAGLQPVDSLFWCAGSWGGLYPFTGHVSGNSHIVRNSSLITARALAKMSRVGYERRTVGEDAMCEAPYTPFLKKSQYQIGQFYPIPETDDLHWIGENLFRWGEHRSLPHTGEDQVWVIWRWTDCCALY